MTEPGYKTPAFWITILGFVLTVLLTFNLINQETADELRVLIEPFIVAAVPLAIYILSRLRYRSVGLSLGLIAPRPAWLTEEFWFMVVSTIAMILLTFGFGSQSEIDTWVQLITKLLAAVLPMIAYLLGYSWEETGNLKRAATGWNRSTE